jgi:hypothetical protein
MRGPPTSEPPPPASEKPKSPGLPRQSENPIIVCPPSHRGGDGMQPGSWLAGRDRLVAAAADDADDADDDNDDVSVHVRARPGLAAPIVAASSRWDVRAVRAYAHRSASRSQAILACLCYLHIQKPAN